ncbi:uncharacterized protein LTR77_010393 [Saxophila tyrrhenica]|uniref:Uncharacterized protein n=1 Tax=Saxophila tyrrhenica TaxID=1690608 RepID=A0AAV9NV91_9PEZI|nr:hypothetical protein LTR77_010393 [Saxophila tyrrhenica]
MQPTRILRATRQPLIKFLGKRNVPKNIDHTPHAHPAAPNDSLPESFAQYRNRAIQHGPLGGQQQQTGQRAQQQQQQSSASSTVAPPSGMEPYGGIGGKSGKQLGDIQPAKGQFFDRDELPARFRRRPFSEAEMEAVDSAGASMW